MGKKSRRIKPVKQRMPFIARTFEGLPAEGDWIALREFVPSATATVRLRDGGSVRFCSLLPGAGAGLVRPDGEIWVGLQVMHNHGDISRDLAHVVELAREVEPGTPIRMTPSGVGDRLQELIDPAGGFELELHDTFDWWLVEEDRGSATAAAALEEANASIATTTRLTGAGSAYVTDMGDRTYLRWILPYDEGSLLDGLARLRAADDDAIVDGTTLIGLFRAHGLPVPVWELDGVAAEDVDAAIGAFATRLDEAMSRAEELTAPERAARRDLVSRQVTIR